MEPQDIGLAAGVLGSLRALGGAVAQAVYVSVLNNEVAKNIPKYVGAAATAAGLPESSLSSLLEAVSSGSSLQGIDGVTESVVTALLTAHKVAYSESFRIVFLCTIPFSVLLVISSCFVPSMRNHVHYQVARRLQGVGKEESVSDVKADTEMIEHV